MKTLIINGSPRKDGDTVGLIELLIKQLNGEYEIVDAYYSDISACRDCRYCWNYDGCSINDEMSEIYNYLVDCDNVVIASPIYFSQPTGKLLDVCSRFQTYFAAKKFRNQKASLKPKRGAVILVGGGDGNPQDAYRTACSLLHHINATEIYPPVGSFNTNKLPATKDEKAIKDIENVAIFLNS
ncbi:MAG: flavodoxin family protein [Clostridia bacterium]|nr:flavodoxin family protein [Clostridia bacterium]